MPRLLKKDTIRLLEASTDSLSLANIGLAIPRKPGDFRCAAELGLIGAAAELAMSACLVEAHGNQILMRDPLTGQYKTGAQILADFKKLLVNPTPRAVFLTEGVAASEVHRSELIKSIERFGLLLTLRANGLHAGRGGRLELAMSIAEDVAKFLSLLSQSAKMKPYLSSIPAPTISAGTKIALVEDLLQEIKATGDKSRVPGLLASAFLVVPSVPSEEPEWLKSLERIQVAFNKDDVAFLVNVLSKAIPVTLVRQSSAVAGSYLPVKFEAENPSAVPVSFEFLKTSYTKVPEQWAGDVGLANGRLHEGRLDLPPIDFVLDLFVIGLDASGLISSDQLLPHAQTWPFIAASLDSRGTTPPYWFLVRKTDDLNQLKAHLSTAKRFSRGNLASKLSEVFEGIDALSNNRALAESSKFKKEMADAAESAASNYQMLSDFATKYRGTERDAGLELERLLVEYTKDDYAMGAVLSQVVKNKFALEEKARLYWVGKIAESMDSEHDRGALLAVLRSSDLTSRHTYARKALRLIDFLDFGPSIES